MATTRAFASLHCDLVADTINVDGVLSPNERSGIVCNTNLTDIAQRIGMHTALFNGRIDECVEREDGQKKMHFAELYTNTPEILKALLPGAIAVRLSAGERSLSTSSSQCYSLLLPEALLERLSRCTRK